MQQGGGARCQAYGKDQGESEPQYSISLGAPTSFSVQGKAGVGFALTLHLPIILQEPISWSSALYNLLPIKPEMQQQTLTSVKILVLCNTAHQLRLKLQPVLTFITNSLALTTT